MYSVCPMVLKMGAKVSLSGEPPDCACGREGDVSTRDLNVGVQCSTHNCNSQYCCMLYKPCDHIVLVIAVRVGIDRLTYQECNFTLWYT